MQTPWEPPSQPRDLFAKQTNPDTVELDAGIQLQLAGRETAGSDKSVPSK